MQRSPMPRARALIILAAFVGVALLLSAAILWPKKNAGAAA